MTNQDRHITFAAFLRRVAAGKVNTIEWNRFAVQHYADEELEKIRRGLVQPSIERADGKEWSDSEIAAMQQWSRQLESR